MPNRILRSSLWESDPFLGLSDNTARLCFVACISIADDLGNFEASPGDLLRLWRDLGITTTSQAEKIITELSTADLVRRYKHGRREYGHIPRFRQRVRHIKRACPEPPDGIKWIETNDVFINPRDDTSDHASVERQTNDGRTSDDTSPTRAEVKRSEVKRRESNNAQLTDSVTTNGAKGKRLNGLGQEWNNPAWVAGTAKLCEVERRSGESSELFRDRVYAALQARIDFGKRGRK